MLVLSRKPSESVVIDGDIRVTVVKISGNRVRLGIEAPPDVAIKRSELSVLAVVPLTGSKDELAPRPACAGG